MTEISFYLFEKSPERQAESACRLSRKILKQPKKIYWLCDDPSQQKQLDELLWQFDANSFIPHGIDDLQASVCISAHLPKTGQWIIVNFTAEALQPQDTFEHIIEIVENQESTKIIGREKFKQYKKLGFSPRTFKL
ncbi:DNA polymerase III subunit chi [Acinetobacter sp. MD2(2019)]|uniref:DNA polymerase III subunit chi n=1 Tax=Acinetobacter sp. MD2(2019) TaxID=2605273 RepID=UPI002D1F574B|nr:DNA polymerase III subunit chi [Acinetobacter sp. MD2(2019)]MEB3753306.1 DNA polymerase III subunit chi [Acinetobacter sp. MD2(2019)]